MSFNSPVVSRRLAAMSRETSSPARDDAEFTKQSHLNPDFMPIPSGANSPIDSPMLRRAAVTLLLGVPASDLNDDSVASWSLDETTTTDESSRASPGPESPGPYVERMGSEAGDISPEPSVTHTHRHARKHYRNELWSAIKSDYMSLMDEGIIDACKSTESELSSDDLSTESKVSYNEFLQQCKELTDWLGHLQLIIQRKTDSRSENYLNQMYHEEMLNQSPRQRLVNDYARQLQRRYPHLKAEITLRLNHVNTLWTEVTDRLVLPPGAGCREPHTMLADIREDLGVLRHWVIRMEKTLAELHIDDKWPVTCLQDKLTEHQSVQKDIESRSRVVTAILKLCEWLSSAEPELTDTEPERSDIEDELAEVQYDAGRLEQRWHGVWIQSVEWQLRLEDAIAGRNTKRLPVHSYDDTDLPRLSCQNDIGHRLEHYSTLVAPRGHSDHESDVGSSDVIPFRDSEYEEVGEDDLMFQFNGSSDSEPEVARRSDGVNEMLDYNVTRVSPEIAIDSALSRSVSDPSLRTTTSGTASHRATAEFLGGCQVVRPEIPDVGYSSEWQSNEEADNSTATQPPSCEQSLNAAAAAAGDDEEIISDAEGHKENVAELSGLPENSNIFRVSSLASRHSATSAYNSSNSDLSDCHHIAARQQPAGNNDVAVASDIDLIGVPPDFYCLTSVDQNGSCPAESSSNLFPSMHREARGDETDEDVARMMELPLDGIPSPRIPVHWGDFPDGQCGYQRRIYGRSLDSLAPLSTDKLFTAEKRVSSVEVIIDSMSSGATPVEETKVFAAAKGDIPRHRRGKNAFSSCDASSEGTISDSDASEHNISSEDDSRFGSGRKRRVYAKRSQKSVRVSPAKSSSSLPVKSPTKRRVDSLTDPAVLVLGEGLPRSVSDGEIIGKFGAVGCKRSKMSRVMICGSPKSGIGRGKKVVASVDGVRSGASRKKVANTCAVTPNSHVCALDFDDVEPTSSALSADEEMLSSYPHILGVAMVTSAADAMVPDMNGSLTSVTNDQSWNDEYQNMYDSSDVNHRVVDNIVSDDWCDSTADDVSMDASLYDNIDDIKVHESGVSRRRPSKGSSRAPPASTWIDSDSDTEDFLNIVSESRKAFQFTESTLTQFSRDHTAGVVVRDPAEYMGPLATCQTNVKCLLELVDALESGGKVNDASNKIRQITEIICRWRDLEARTVTQQHECRQLFILHVERVRLERELDVMAREVDFDRFDDIDSLENTLRTVQGVSSELRGRVNEQLTALAQRVDRYNRSHPAVELSRLVAAIESLYQTCCHLTERCESAENQLKTSLMAWHQLNELECHLVYVLNHEQHQLECLGVATDIVGLSQQDCQETVHDLKLMRDGWSVHSSKLRLMESLFAEVSEVCTVHAQCALRDALNAVSTDLHTLYTHCDKIVSRVEQTQQASCDDMLSDVECNVSDRDCIDGIGSDTMESISCVAGTTSAVSVTDTTSTASRRTTESDMQTDDTICARSRSIDELILEKLSSFEEKLLTCSTPRKLEQHERMDDETIPLEKVPADIPALRITEKAAAAVRPTVALKAGSPSTSLLRRLLKYALPLPFLLILLFGSFYLLFDDWFSQLDRYGLVINPQRQHVRGAPPI